MESLNELKLICLKQKLLTCIKLFYLKIHKNEDLSLNFLNQLKLKYQQNQDLTSYSIIDNIINKSCILINNEFSIENFLFSINVGNIASFDLIYDLLEFYDSNINHELEKRIEYLENEIYQLKNNNTNMDN
jgi:hypothetical protein